MAELIVTTELDALLIRARNAHRTPGTKAQLLDLIDDMAEVLSALSSETRQEWRIAQGGMNVVGRFTTDQWNENYSLWDAVREWYPGGHVETRFVTDFDTIVTPWREVTEQAGDHHG